MAIQCGISAIPACTEGVQWRTEYKVGTLPYISGNPVKPLGYAECTPVHQKRLNFPYNSFQLCLDFSGTANYLAKLKKKMGTLLAAAPCPYPSAFPPNRHIFFFQIWSWWRCRQMKAKPHSVSGAAEFEYVNCSTRRNRSASFVIF